MRHFNNLSDEDQDKIFYKKPHTVTNASSKELIAASLGASLYTPSTRKDLARIVEKNGKLGLSSMIICLEDSIADNEVIQGEANVKEELPKIALIDESVRPLLFIRVRTPEHLAHVIEQNYANLDVLTGFVLPKFNGLTNAQDYISIIKETNETLAQENRPSLYFMPVLESPELVYRESRDAFLVSTKTCIDSASHETLAIRLGATDMSSPYGLRRSRDLTVYDVHVVSSAIADVVNVFGRSANGHQITGVVWEHFTDRERLFKPSLRQTPFDGNKASRKMRASLVINDLDGLMREVELDRANGILGKTVIHPDHVALVNSMMIITHEEYSDAMDIMSGSSETAGAAKSSYSNKMNEQKPHRSWAQKTLLRAQAFGVANPEINFAEILEIGIAENV